MDPIYDAFRVALRERLANMGRGGQRKLAEISGISPTYINHIVQGRNYGAEDVRRRLALALGYEYEAFLSLGRSLMGEGDPPPKPEYSSWTQELIPDLERIPPGKRDVVRAMIKALLN